MRKQTIRNERGVALFFALLLLVVASTLAIGAIMLSGNVSLISRFHAKEAEMQASADAGLEWGRDTLNGSPALLPPVGVVTLQNAQPVRDASGAVIPGYTRSVFAGRSGATTGQFGVFASVISQIDDNAGRAVVVRRAELAQESFAKFARFDDTTLSSIVFANGIQVFGPIHTNGILYVASSATPAVFHGLATTAATINSAANGTFKVGYKTGVARINMPTPANLATLDGYATAANLSIAGGAVGTTVYTPSTRIEFVAVDLNADGDFSDDDEGFIRVYRSNNTTAAALNYVTAREWNSGSSTDPNASSPNCGDRAGGTFLSAAAHTNANPAPHNHTTASQLANQRLSLNHATRRCYLGGDPRLNDGVFSAVTLAPGNYGAWVRWPGWGAGNAPARIAAGTLHPSLGGGVVGATMADYLWPISRLYNPEYKGVIYVSGSVGVSGMVRGQVTLASTGNILLADDLTYVTSPGSIPDCDRSGGINSDILGLLTAQFFMIENNTVNAPFRAGSTSGTTGGYVNGYDDSADETVHAAVLTLNSVMSEALGTGSTNSEVCAGGAVGRGCFNMVGAAIQGKNAARMQSGSGGATGWNPQWTYDRCDGVKPPPYFPTTGRFYKNRYYEIDPVGFTVAGWFAANQ